MLTFRSFITLFTITLLLEIINGSNMHQSRYCIVQSDRLIPPSQPKCSPSNITNWYQGRDEPADIADDTREDILPPWIDFRLVKRGQEFAKNNLASVFLAHLFGLFTSTYPDGAHMLQFSRMSNTPGASRTRYIATGAQILTWYQSKLWKNEKEFIVSLFETRKRHAAIARAARERIAKVGDDFYPHAFPEYVFTTAVGGPFIKDLKEGITKDYQRQAPPSSWTNITIDPFNQQIASLTQFAFVGIPILYPERIGIIAKDEDLLAFMHLWAVIGYGMGIKDEYNICLQPDLKTARKLYTEMFERFCIASLFHMDRDTKILLENTLWGMSKLASGINLSPNLQLYLMMRHILRIPGKHTYAQLSIPDRITAAAFKRGYINGYKMSKPFRDMINSMIIHALRLSGEDAFGANVFNSMKGRSRYAFFSKFE